MKLDKLTEAISQNKMYSDLEYIGYYSSELHDVNGMEPLEGQTWGELDKRVNKRTFIIASFHKLKGIKRPSQFITMFNVTPLQAG